MVTRKARLIFIQSGRRKVYFLAEFFGVSMSKTNDSIWHATSSVADLNSKAEGTLNHNLGIEITEITNDSLKGRMSVDERTVQPAGVLHGGASVAFAETLASWAGYLVIDSSQFHVVGQEINANHLRPGIAGEFVYGEATAIHLGRKAHVWQIHIRNEQGKLVCISRCTLAVITMPGQYAAREDRG